MSRILKFRAWDGEQKKMCHKVYLGPEGWHGEYWENGVMVSCFSDDNHKDNCLMQFTGLHDKNGKEIWEGDILAITLLNGYTKQISKVVRSIVDFKKGAFGADMWGNNAENSKVLGNIYEHPELLDPDV